MAEPLKNMFDLPFLRQFGVLVHSGWSSFEEERFVRLVTRDDWDKLELKGRIRRITESLGATLPPDFAAALDVLYRIDEQCVGFPYLFFPDFVEVYGMDHWELSMEALERFTSKSSAEFAIRPFLLAQTDRTMERMRQWAEHESEHVRRLASEGCRPRLPWASALGMFKLDPSPILPILEKLKCDDSLYVRKSVANNLNDIAKDHPDLVRRIASQWSGRHPLTDWIVRRGCRTLLRADDEATMALLGYDGAAAAEAISGARLTPRESSARMGGFSELDYELQLQIRTPLRLRIELGVDYVKAGGKISQKRFLVADRAVSADTRITGMKKLDWKELTTRKHYPGVHKLHLLVGGRPVATAQITLVEEDNRTPAEEGAT
ncbi:DNA alkylation repair protein [Paenibacillus nasutitermitis]|uniref:DNA alkylation repair protein n=1 Tax=Paenibacillus nasutitermitis TaxID=1652958 RepID=A0A916ZBW6_9BACL|nr:DNA alkylation repair protein [Paenibacillus nasutitermitis]GGD86731.1 hypothetical protein GCM10010911_51520 [Paenibacillus nasutitermitis]